MSFAGTAVFDVNYVVGLIAHGTSVFLLKLKIILLYNTTFMTFRTFFPNKNLTDYDCLVLNYMIMKRYYESNIWKEIIEME